MIDIKIGNYRIANISHISADGVKQMDEEYGVGIEKVTNKGTGYYAILFVKYNEKDAVCFIESRRLLDIPSEDWETVKDLIRIASDIVAVCNRNKK